MGISSFSNIEFGKIPIKSGFAMDGYWVWCCSAIKSENGKYYLFASRWPKTTEFFNGYLLNSEIVIAVSDNILGPYHFQEVVFQRRQGFWDGQITSNPSIHKYKDGYVLFYIGSTYDKDEPIEDNKVKQCYWNIRIGMATSKSINGDWKRLDSPVLEPLDGKWDHSIVTNPAPCILENGQIYMLYRSYDMKIGVARAKDIDSPFERISDKPILDLADGCSIEDPFLWWEKDHFELLAKDMTGDICGEKHAGIHATSRDAINWTISSPAKAYSRKLLWENDKTTIQGSLERPNLFFENGRPVALFAATGDGIGGFENAKNTWSIAIPITRAEEN